jgi:hypothetical protein
MLAIDIDRLMLNLIMCYEQCWMRALNTVCDKRPQFRLFQTVKLRSFISQVAQEEVTMQNCVWCRNCHSATRQPLFDVVNLLINKHIQEINLGSCCTNRSSCFDIDKTGEPHHVGCACLLLTNFRLESFGNTAQEEHWRHSCANYTT